MKKQLVSYLGGALFVGLFVFACSESASDGSITEDFESGQKLENTYKDNLKSSAMYLDSLVLSSDDEKRKEYFLKSKRFFKKAEPVLAYVEVGNYKYLNAPNLLKISEEDPTNIRKQRPSGFQVIEELLFQEESDVEAVNIQVEVTKHKLIFIHKNTDLGYFKKDHFLKMLRDQVIRIATLGITGFDSPVLGVSLKESQLIYTELELLMDYYSSQYQDSSLYQAWKLSIAKSIEDLDVEFDSFDRYHFIKENTQEQMKLWKATVDDWGVNFAFPTPISPKAEGLFSKETFDMNHFTDPVMGELTVEKIALGKKLFFDANLSADKKMSCSSCHIESLGFSDGLTSPEGQVRNSPTIAYAAFQRSFFHDSRALSLEGQIVGVFKNPVEFNTTKEVIEEYVRADSNYVELFNRSYGKAPSDMLIRNSIANYVRSLPKYNSIFDISMSGGADLNQEQINGFNLFMGKALCATCHFPPNFDGTVPPYFKESELENIGVPSTLDSVGAVVSNDPGRYNVFGVEERRSFFKTPSVRNIAKTAPYMHNGVYKNLEQVLEFYKNGGGEGLGIKQRFQTLPFDSLTLTKEEMGSIIAFMETLSDR